MSKTPLSLGYHMPAEWGPHEATWLAWPGRSTNWPSKKYPSIQKVFLQIIEELLVGEKIHLLVSSRAESNFILKNLKHAAHLGRLIFHFTASADIWVRDYGPVFLKNKSGQKAWCKWRFNAWGGKYKNLMRDNRIFSRRLVPFPCFQPEMILEGGSIEVNGRGICLVTEQCLLNPNRNPRFTRADVEKKLQDFLGVQEVIWLGRGIQGDDTDGHIDQLARFVSPDTILAAYEENSSDANYRNLKENWERLPRSLNLIKLPMPGIVRTGKKRLPASYANFYIASKSVLVPAFGDKKDERAAGILKDHFPKRRMVPIPSRDLIHGLGGIHCMTQQEPK
ncbi:MAG: agmatine deiminase family protein [Candidatus Omnitrophica bacterium]|nr:agmatine deiminase family protein [Candidatus Omnitrophota bacterium]